MICQHRDRYIQRLEGLYYQLCRDKRCPEPQCEGHGTRYRPLVDLRLALPRMWFGLDVVLHVGERHLGQNQSLSQIGRDLTAQRVPIHQTHVGELLRSFVALCKVARGDEQAVRDRLTAQGGIYLMLDGVQFDDRSPVLYLCWDALSGTPLFGQRLEKRDARALSNLLLRVKRMGVPVRGITTDAERGLVPAVCHVFPEVPYQLCRTHFLHNCARPMEADLQQLGASVARRAERVQKLLGRMDSAPVHSAAADKAPLCPAEPVPPALPDPAQALPTPAPATAPGPAPVPSAGALPEPITDKQVAHQMGAWVRLHAKVSGKAPLDPPALVRHRHLEQIRSTVEHAAQKKTLRARRCPPPRSRLWPRL